MHTRTEQCIFNHLEQLQTYHSRVHLLHVIHIYIPVLRGFFFLFFKYKLKLILFKRRVVVQICFK